MQEEPTALGYLNHNLTTQAATTYCPFNGEPIACKQGNLVTYLHHDQVGSLVSATNSVGQEVFSARYWPLWCAPLLDGHAPHRSALRGADSGPEQRRLLPFPRALPRRDHREVPHPRYDRP